MSRRSWVKVLILWIAYVAFHMAHYAIPGPLATLLSCEQETIFTHMKMSFFTYLIYSLIEVPLLGRRSGAYHSLLTSRALSLVIYPYLTFFVWFIVPTLRGAIMPTAAMEVTYSNMILALCLVCTVAIEQAVEKVRFAKPATISVLFLFAVSLVQYAILPFRRPDIDVFTPHNHGSSETTHSQDAHDRHAH